MIVKGGSRSGAGYWGKHLDDTTRINESAEIVYAEGVEGDTPKDILKEYADMAKRSRVQKFLYHMIFNNKGDRHLTAAEEIKAYKAAAIKMGMEGQPFFIVRHKEANGEQHFHTMTLRVGEDGKAVNDVYGDRYKLMDVAREIENDLGLRSMDDVEKRLPQAKILKSWERFSGAETGYTARRVGNDLKKIKKQFGGGARFAKGLEATTRYILAKGDKGGFVVIDRASGVHPLTARLGLRQSAVDRFMQGVDRHALPTVKAARAQQRTNQKEENRGIIAACSSWGKKASPQNLFDELTAKGFIVARGDKRGVLMVVDKNGLYVSLERASGLGKKAFSERMKAANTSKLPSLDQALITRKAERGEWKAGQPESQPEQRSRRHGRTTKQIADDYLNLCRHPLQDLRGWVDATGRAGESGHNLPSQSRASVASNDGLRQVRKEGGLAASTGGGASAARSDFPEIRSKYASMIDAAYNRTDLDAIGIFALVQQIKRLESDEIGAAEKAAELVARPAHPAYSIKPVIS